jgi:hypothetical protein
VSLTNYFVVEHGNYSALCNCRRQVPVCRLTGNLPYQDFTSTITALIRS